jgi:hypothetical protein
MVVSAGRTWGTAGLAQVFSAEFNLPATMHAIPRFLKLPIRARFSGWKRWPVLIRGTAWLGAILIVGWVLAGWFWQLAAPVPAPDSVLASLSDYPTAARAIAARHLFGKPSSIGDELDGDRSAPRFRLLGAMTASPERAGFAILTEEGKPPVAALEGETFQPGVTLLEILPGQVRLKIEDRVESIEMTEVKETVAPNAARPQANTLPRAEFDRR